MTQDVSELSRIMDRPDGAHRVSLQYIISDQSEPFCIYEISIKGESTLTLKSSPLV